jgi:hypothetical protein
MEKKDLINLLKGNTKITISEFRKKHPGIKMSDFQFYDCRRLAMNKPYKRDGTTIVKTYRRSSMIFKLLPVEEVEYDAKSIQLVQKLIDVINTTAEINQRLSLVEIVNHNGDINKLEFRMSPKRG